MSKAAYVSLETETEGQVEALEADQEDAELAPPKPFCTRTVLCGAGVTAAALCSLIAITILFYHRSMDIKDDAAVEKLGAGLFLVSEGDVLLLLRKSKHNDNTWGLPGGNADDADADLLATAMREGAEEMGGVPPCNVSGQVLTKRGKKGQKHYTVFVCDVDAAARTAFVPALNDEHREAQWWPLAALPPVQKLHPVVATLLQDPGAHKQLGAALPAGLHVASNTTMAMASGGDAMQGGAGGKASVGGLAGGERIEKQGAGMLLADGGKVLLLRKKGGKHGPGKWQMPGGGSDSKDADALATAEREALEEVGGVPSHSVVGQIELKKVGKKGVKLYTVILARVDQAGVSATFTPDLEDDHHEVGWVELAEAVNLPAAQLQPHLADALSPAHRAELAAAFGVAL